MSRSLPRSLLLIVALLAVWSLSGCTSTGYDPGYSYGYGRGHGYGQRYATYQYGYGGYGVGSAHYGTYHAPLSHGSGCGCGHGHGHGHRGHRGGAYYRY